MPDSWCEALKKNPAAEQCGRVRKRDNERWYEFVFVIGFPGSWVARAPSGRKPPRLRLEAPVVAGYRERCSVRSSYGRFEEWSFRLYLRHV